MASLLLAVIYLAFISLGLPDSILGSAWPSMYSGLNVPLSYVGIISMIITGGTILSSLLSGRLIRKCGTGAVTAGSVAMTAAALLGFSVSGRFWQLCLWGVPYGLGAGSVDAALNNFVALHYKSRHMNWLHCFWGVGATAGPYLMGLCLIRGQQWTAGYLIIGAAQVTLVLFLLLSLPLWHGAGHGAAQAAGERGSLGTRELLRLPGAKAVLGAFFCYCALESTAGLWASSYLALFREIPEETAAKWAALFYLGITAGRFLGGFVTGALGDQAMVRAGQIAAGAGVTLLLLPLGQAAALWGLILTGLGCAPIFPGLLHETPDNFGPENSQSLMGLQMACAYVGTTFVSPLFGVIAERLGIGLYPVYLLALAALMSVMTERMNRVRDRQGN